MFAALKNEVTARFDAIDLFLKASKNLKEDQAAIIKGLMFVQVYAVYEYTVRSVVRLTIDSIKAHNHKMKDVTPSMMALFLDPEWDSLRDAGRRNEWEGRLKIFERAFSSDPLDLSSNTKLPTDGSHYRYTQLLMIFRVFGIKRLPVRRRRHQQRIEEVVDHRNAIAHGEERAEDIGRRYARSDIVRMVRQMRSVCLLLINVFDSFCADSSRHKR